jgi:RHS repeat-associated protein
MQKVDYHYYPFGMLMLGRTYTSEAYGYGFNGMQKDDEVSGSGNNLDFGARIYDSRLGRWMSVDPLSSIFVYESNYSYTSNNPILYVDIDGEKKVVTHVYIDQKTGASYSYHVETSNEIMSEPREQILRVFGIAVDNITKETVYDWYDINETVVHVMADGKEISKTKSVTIGKFRTTTNGDSYTYASLKVNGLTPMDGDGVMWTTSNSNGTSEETRKTNNIKVNQENIDLLLATLSAIGSGGAKFEIPKTLQKDIPILEVLNELQKRLNKMEEGSKKVFDIATEIGKQKESSGSSKTYDERKVTTIKDSSGTISSEVKTELVPKSSGKKDTTINIKK